MKPKISELFLYDKGAASIDPQRIEEVGLKLKCPVHLQKGEWKQWFDDDNTHVISYKDRVSDVWYPYMLHEYVHAVFFESFPCYIESPISLFEDEAACKREIDYCFNTANDWFVNAFIMKLYPTEMKEFLSEPYDEKDKDVELQQLNKALAYAESARHLGECSFLPINDSTIERLYHVFINAPTEMSWQNLYAVIKGLFKAFGNLDIKESTEDSKTYWDIFRVSTPGERFARMEVLPALPLT